jgi:hypothetical protein
MEIVGISERVNDSGKTNFLKKLEATTPATYRIWVQDHLDNSCFDRLGGWPYLREFPLKSTKFPFEWTFAR